MKAAKRNVLAATGLLALAAGAAAQSNVTIFGIVDVGVRQVKNEGSDAVKSMISGGMSSGRLGFRGTEDLGDGLKAGFWIESTVAADAGNGGAGPLGGSSTAPAQFWDRRSIISLSHDKLGSVLLGRDYAPTFMTWVDQDPFGNNGVATGGQFSGAGARSVLDAFGASTAPRTDVRVNNTVQYLLPDELGGVYGGLMISPTEGTTATGGGKVRGGRLGFKTGPFDASAAYLQTMTDRAGNPWIKDTAVGASYQIGPAKLSAAYRQFKYLNSKQANYMIAGSYNLGQGQIKANYVRGNAQGRTVNNTNIDDNDGTKFGLGYIYFLSKRTALYSHVARVSNDGTATSAITGGGPITPGGNSTGFEFGMRHTF